MQNGVKKASQALNDAILNTVSDCIISIDSEGRIIEFNRAAEKTFNYKKDDVVGHGKVIEINGVPVRELQNPKIVEI